MVGGGPNPSSDKVKGMKLLQAFEVRGLVLKNRIVMPAMCPNFASGDGFSTDRLKNYYVTRARGGVGLIITENAYITRDGLHQPNQIGLDNENKVQKLIELTSAIHAEGGKVFVQLNHGGRNSLASITGHTPVAPSPIRAFRYVDGNPPRELSIGEIRDLVKAYGQAALFAREAGFDGVEIHGTHGFLVAQFLSKYTNKRFDEYGGTLENRVRFLREILHDVRIRVGQDYPISVRISAEEFVPGGNSIDDAKYIAKVIEEEGGDIVNVSLGQSPSSPGDRDYQVIRHQNIPPMDFPPACWVAYAASIKEAVKLPIMTVGRINEPKLGEWILQEGWADLVGMGRALIADPELPRKLAEGRISEIRNCVACNQGCADRVYRLEPIECMINPQVGYEEKRRIGHAFTKRSVLVVGGGPAGMEAARVAALSGHQVLLMEKLDDLGGQLRLAAAVPFRESFASYLAYQKATLLLHGVKVVVGKKVTADEIKEIAADIVILATGASPRHISIPGGRTANVANAWDILSGRAKAKSPALVIGGGSVGLETGEFLSKAGIRVTIVEMTELIGRNMFPGIRALILDRLSKADVRIFPKAEVVAIEDDRVIVKVGDHEVVFSAATVVEAIGALPDDELKRSLDMKGISSVVVGDCKLPRDAYQAIHEGFLAALSV